MLSSGNGDAARCVENLVKTVQGEVPFERFKGMPRELVDGPSVDAYRAEAAVVSLVGTYEPRVSVSDVRVEFPEPALGMAGIHVYIE